MAVGKWYRTKEIVVKEAKEAAKRSEEEQLAAKQQIVARAQEQQKKPSKKLGKLSGGKERGIKRKVAREAGYKDFGAFMEDVLANPARHPAVKVIEPPKEPEPAPLIESPQTMVDYAKSLVEQEDEFALKYVNLYDFNGDVRLD